MLRIRMASLDIAILIFTLEVRQYTSISFTYLILHRRIEVLTRSGLGSHSRLRPPRRTSSLPPRSNGRQPRQADP
jgi:hypothetical protein